METQRSMGPFSDRQELDDIAHRMFRQFARMEYALKASRYLVRQDGEAQPSWTAFAADIDPSFVTQCEQDEELGEAVNYLMKHPPKKQIVRGGELDWSDAPPTAETPTGVVFLYVARVRNNLFHGGKFNGSWIDPERSMELLPRCLTILDRSLMLSDRVRAAYEH